MGFFGSKKQRAAPSSPTPKPKVDHLGYPIDQPQCLPPQPPADSRWPPQSGPPNSISNSQPAGYLPPPSSWNAPQSTLPPPPYQELRPYGPIIVNQHYYLSPPSAHPASCHSNPLSKLNFGSVINLAHQIVPSNVHPAIDDGLPRWHCHATQLLNQSAALYDQIQSKFNDVMTSIDCEHFTGNEKALFQYHATSTSSNVTPPTPSPPVDRGQVKKRGKRDAPKGQTTAVASSLISGGYFAKVELYANSRLPMDLPPLKL